MPVVSPTSPAKAPIFAIVIHEKGGAERREVFESAEISLGRVQGNDLMLPKGNVSKRHARLLYRDGRFIVTDLNSTNGTYVNRRRITQATIVREGDRIYIGDFVLRIETPAPAQEQSVSMPVPSVVPATRTPGPASSESHPSALPRPTSVPDEDDEQTRSASRNLRSSPATAEMPAAQVGRTTQTDEDAAQRQAQLEVVALIVERVARTLPNAQLESEQTTELSGRDQLLRDAWNAVSAERAGVGALPMPLERLTALARAELFELGPLGELLADPAVTEIAVVGHDRISAVRGGRLTLCDVAFSCESALRWAIARLCARSGTPLADAREVERRLDDGTSVSAAIAPAGASVLSIRRPRRLSGTLDELVRRGTVSRAIASFLTQCLLARLNVLVVGPRDGGTDLLLGALATAAPEGEVVYVGDLAPPPGRATQRLLVEGSNEQVARAIGLAARAPLLRLVVELGNPAVTEAVFGAVADGADGVIAVRSAGSVRRALLRLRSDLSSRRAAGAEALVAGTFEVVVEIARLRDDRHRVLRVSEVLGTSANGELELSDIFNFVIDRTAAGGMIEGSFSPASGIPAVVDMIRSRGAPVDTSLFGRPASR